MGYQYRRDSRGIGEILMSDDMQAAMVKAAEAGRGHAQSIAPVKSGEYAGAFRVEPEKFKDRAGAVIVNDAPHAAAVESRMGILSRTGDMLESQ